MENRALKREPGERFVQDCDNCPCGYFGGRDGVDLQCALDEMADCFDNAVPKDCPLKNNPVTLRVSDA